MHLATSPAPRVFASHPEPSFLSAMQHAGPWEQAPHLCVAVSGGADSMALALLAQCWAVQHGGRVSAVMIDHGLRPDAAQELENATNQLSFHAIDCYRITLSLPAGCTQAQARKARYDALTGWCNRHSVLHLLLGHHADDQAETLLLRWLAGSAPAGLAAMATITYRDGVRLLRPLLGVRKDDVQQYLKQQAIIWCEDPTNQLPVYRRNRLRQLLTQAEPLSQQRLQECAFRLGRWRSEQERQQHEILAHEAVIWPEGVGFLRWQGVHHPCAVALISALCCTIGGQLHPPRTHMLCRAVEMLRLGKKITLHGCVMEPFIWQGHKGYLCYREYQAVSALRTHAKPGEIRWDRFVMRLSEALPPGCHIAALGPAGWQQIRRHAQTKAYVPYRVAVGLPALWHLDRCLLAPHIMPDSVHGTGVQSVWFNPAKSLGNSPFSAM